MVSLRRVYPCRVHLLNCNQIHPSLLQSLSPANLSWPISPAPATKPAANSSPEDSTDYDVLDIWRPLSLAPAPTSQTSRNWADEPSSSDSAMLNVWMCPEIDSRQRRERARRRKAEQLAEQMAAPVQVSNKDRDTKKQERERRGTKRKADEQVESAVPVAPFLPSSPDLLKPQSLLIPALLPKGMLRSQPDNAVVPTMVEPQAVRSLPRPALDLSVWAASGSGGMETSGDMPFGLGLDLGFDIAQNSLKRDPMSGGGSGMSNSIMEIANFLERDIDVFTPLSAARTPRSAVVPSMPVALPTSSGSLNPKSPGAKQRELIEDILKLSF
ncbi:hypothetical protein GGI19_000448 [Coemansia pectinata]|uniref:Uncharacterized protein n=1 Tax=Coemansia pectinata TaxID=1052879 RepID=A0A9W8H3K2_9FUNG|nr:hypothetical protein GGI19_000448 [Coemansia pectinata]